MPQAMDDGEPPRQLVLPDGREFLEGGGVHEVDPETCRSIGETLLGTLDGRPLAEIAERISWCPWPRSLQGRVSLRTQMTAAAAHFAEPIDPIALDLVEATGAARLLDGETWYLSAGEETLAALAVATARPFELLAVDQPLAGLDRRNRRAVRAWLDAVASTFLVVVAPPPT